MNKHFAFNVTFTRPNENDEHVYTVGYNVYSCETVEEAERELREEHFDHLTVRAVVLVEAIDFVVSNHGSVFTVEPQGDSARAHLIEHTADDSQWFGGSLVVEHRYVGDFVNQLVEDGWVVR